MENIDYQKMKMLQKKLNKFEKSVDYITFLVYNIYTRKVI